MAAAGRTPASETAIMIDIRVTEARLRDHIRALTVDIGERSVLALGNLKRAAGYIRDFYQGIGLPVRLEPYDFQGFEVANVVAGVHLDPNPSRRVLIGAHYDSVAGTVGADDNASAVAVQLETARQVMALKGSKNFGLAAVFVSFALEEPPAYGTPYMGSRIYAKQARRRNEPIDAMLCLEMVGYTCHEPGCQSYPFPLMFFGSPPEGNFIGIVGNFESRGLTHGIFNSFRKNPELPAVRLSDHASFWDEGFKAVMITDSAFYRNPHYHLPSDRPESLDFRFMAELVQSLVTFLAQPP
jgi:Zn-dependent M28 family amino/carboxypeptidase